MLSKIKVGETVAILGFTGMRLADLPVSGVTKTHVKVTKSDGTDMIFDKKTGVQTNVAEGKEKYANKAMPVDQAPERKPKKKAEPKKKKAPKKVEPVEEVEEDLEEEEEEEEEPAPKKKPAAKKKAAPKKKAPVVEEEDEWEDEEDEEWDDEE